MQKLGKKADPEKLKKYAERKLHERRGGVVRQLETLAGQREKAKRTSESAAARCGELAKAMSARLAGADVAEYVRKGHLLDASDGKDELRAYLEAHRDEIMNADIDAIPDMFDYRKWFRFQLKVMVENEEKVFAQMPVIVSASRSTDMPAFYSDWFVERFNNGNG